MKLRLSWEEYFQEAKETFNWKSLAHIAEKAPNDDVRKEAGKLLSKKAA